MTREQAEVLVTFTEMLQAVTADGGRKRAAGLKPSWKIDPSHRVAIFSHLYKYERGERVDPDSGAHPFVHLAWRALAVAWQDTHADEIEALESILKSGQELRDLAPLPPQREES